MVLWILDTLISTAEMSPDDSGRMLCVKIAHHRTVRVKDAKERSQGEINTIMCEKRLASSSSPHGRDTRGTQEVEKKKKHIKYSLCFLNGHVNMRLSDCSIFSTDLQNDERGGWCKSYNCCSVLERELAQGGRKTGAKEEKGKDKLTDRLGDKKQMKIFSGSFREERFNYFILLLMHSHLQPDQLFTQYFLVTPRLCCLVRQKKKKNVKCLWFNSSSSVGFIIYSGLSDMLCPHWLCWVSDHNPQSMAFSCTV